ncbi:MAG: TonB-dependent receptor [Bacteroidia bacterium]|nr:TonB-dependent receptor [Bacteroidia bacterium]
MLKISVAVLCCALSLGSKAQSIVSGTIRDAKTKEVLVGATVQLENQNRIAVSDERGLFELTRIPDGQISLLIKFLGYVDFHHIVNVSGNVHVEFTLEESAQLTDEVVVYATRANDKTPTTFTNVSGLALQKQNFGQDMPQLLNWTPSLVTTSDAGTGIGYTGLRIRGSDATRINVTINGIPYNDSESQGTYWVDIPDVASSTQSVQIQRGVGTSTNGGSAFGGSVNLQTNSLQTDPYSEVILVGGSFNTQRYTLKAGTGLINNRWAFDGKVSRITSDGYVDRASSDLSSYYLSGGYYGKRTIVKFITFGGHEKTYQSWNGNDSETMKTNRTFNSAGAFYDANWNVTDYYDNEVDDYRQDHYQVHLTQKLSDNWNANVSLHYTYGRGYYEQYKQDNSFASLGLTDIVLKDTTITSGDFIVRRWLDNKFYGTTFSFNYEKEKTSLAIGGAFNQYGHARHFGEIIWGQYAANSQIRQHYYDGVSQKNDFNIYAKWNYEISTAVNAFVDLQYRTVDYKTSGINDDLMPYDINEIFNFFNPKAGLSYSLSPSDVLYGSYAIANREPNRTDYLDGVVKPKAEKLGNIETGWRRNQEKYKIEANYFMMNYTDQLVLTGKLDNVGNPIRENIGKSYRTGVELSGVLRVTDRWTWNTNVTWSVNKNKDFVVDETKLNEKQNTSIILSPKWIAGSQLTWNAFTSFKATLLTKYVGKQYLDNTQTESLTLEHYFINDMSFNYTLTPKGMKAIELSLLVNNLFDVKYSSNGATYGDGVAYYYPQAGRNFLAMVAVKF